MKIVTLLGLISRLAVVNSATVLSPSSSSNGSKTTYFTGLLSDVLLTNRENDLAITSRCNRELSEIQNGLDMRDVWAIKCKYCGISRRKKQTAIKHFGFNSSINCLLCQILFETHLQRANVI